MTTIRFMLMALVAVFPLRAWAGEAEEVERGDAVAEPRWGIELAIGRTFSNEDGYTDRLESFGFEQALLFPDLNGLFEVSLLASIYRYLDALLELSLIENDFRTREIIQADGSGDIVDRFSWNTVTITAAVRPTLRSAEDIGAFYLQLGAGAGISSTTLSRTRDGVTLESSDETQLGITAQGGAGFRISPWRHVGFGCHVAYVYAPIMENLLGDIHNSGGWKTTAVISARF